MIILEAEQGSQEWLDARLGIPTASCFDKIITASGKASSQQNAYMGTLLAEWRQGKGEDFYVNDDMIRGNEMEPIARAYYEFTTGTQVDQVGMMYLDDKRLVAASPDGLIGDNGGLEIKCPRPGNHMGYYLDNKCPPKYLAQVQGNLWVSGREWWDFVSYHEDFPAVIVRVQRNEKFIKALATEVDAFVDRMLNERKKLKPLLQEAA